MTVSTILDDLQALRAKAEGQLAAADDLDSIEAVRIEFLGRKGAISLLKRNLKDVAPEDRPKVGTEANAISEWLETELNQKKDALEVAALNQKLAGETIDITMPGVVQGQGGAHPITRMMDELAELFGRLGFTCLDDTACPEVETEYYNFDALNFPAHHPARDMQDTFYTDAGENVVLRSQTSNAQIRHMQKFKPPIRVISPGRVYRNEDVSRQKHVLFHQCEGLVVDKHITVAHLKGTLNHFIEEMFGLDDNGNPRATRFRTSYFPFTEPSMEMDVMYRRQINGEWKEDWLEILGCGMVDPNVLSEVGVDPEEYTGFAFGMGVERLAMLKYGIHNIRDFFINDQRFLRRHNWAGLSLFK